MPRSGVSVLIKALCALAFTAGALIGCTTTPARTGPEPALWVLRDSDSTIYLFGTIHALKPDDNWRTPRIISAFEESDRLVLEIAALDDREFMGGLVREHGVDMSVDLSTRLPDGCRQQLAPVAEQYGMDMRGVERLRPWVAALSLGQAPLTRSGYDLSLGVDMQLKAAATERGLSIGGLETPQDQVMSLATLSESLQVTLLCSVLDGMEEIVPQLENVRTAWMNGDQSVMDALLSQEIRSRYPELYTSFIVRRNRVMAEQIQAELAGTGTVFVAVGAAHLAGPDSVQIFLGQAGVSVRQVGRR